MMMMCYVLLRSPTVPGDYTGRFDDASLTRPATTSLPWVPMKEAHPSLQPLAQPLGFGGLAGPLMPAPLKKRWRGRWNVS